MKSCWCEVTNEYRCCQDCEDVGRCNDQCHVFCGWADESECKGGDDLYAEVE